MLLCKLQQDSREIWTVFFNLQVDKSSEYTLLLLLFGIIDQVANCTEWTLEQTLNNKLKSCESYALSYLLWNTSVAWVLFVQTLDR